MSQSRLIATCPGLPTIDEIQEPPVRRHARRSMPNCRGVVSDPAASAGRFFFFAMSDTVCLARFRVL